MTVWPCTSGLSTVLSAFGSLTATPCCNIGAISIMMMSSTSMTSTSGVTLISDLTPPLAPPRSIEMGTLLDFQAADVTSAPRAQCRGAKAEVGSQTTLPSTVFCGRRFLRRLLDEVVDQLGRRVVHLDVEVLDAAAE